MILRSRLTRTATASAISAAITGAGLLVACLLPIAGAAGPQVITLTQTACQFLEAEAQDHHYESTRKSDCETINNRSAVDRLKSARTLDLKPGRYVFRVRNRDVPYGVGFWLRGDGLVARATLPGVSGTGLSTGIAKDYEVNLVEGDYVYSCPLNSTPDYPIKVRP